MAEIFKAHHWHQTWEVESGFSTPGHNPIELILNKCRIPEDLTGKSVLDVGAWNGCYSFECEKRGARKVVAADLWNPDHTGFNSLKTYLNSQVTYQQVSVYDLSSEQLGEFDIVFFSGYSIIFVIPSLLSTGLSRSVRANCILRLTFFRIGCFIGLIAGWVCFSPL